MITYEIRATDRAAALGLVFVEITRNGHPWRGLVVSDQEAARMVHVFDEAADQARHDGVRQLPIGPLLRKALGRDPFADESSAVGDHEDNQAAD